MCSFQTRFKMENVWFIFTACLVASLGEVWGNIENLLTMNGNRVHQQGIEINIQMHIVFPDTSKNQPQKESTMLMRVLNLQEYDLNALTSCGDISLRQLPLYHNRLWPLSLISPASF